MDGKGVTLKMTPKIRFTRLYVCGATSTGKSEMLESLIRHDIKQWHKNKCGALVFEVNRTSISIGKSGIIK